MRIRALEVVLLILAGILLFAWPVFAANETYTYDVYGRLLTVTYADGSTVTYTYDAAGNRTVLTQAAAP